MIPEAPTLAGPRPTEGSWQPVPTSHQPGDYQDIIIKDDDDDGHKSKENKKVCSSHVPCLLWMISYANNFVKDWEERSKWTANISEPADWRRAD